MSSNRTLLDVIAGLPETEINRLRERNLRDLERAKAEVQRLQVQEHLFNQALARLGGKRGRPGQLTAEVVLDAASRTEPPMTASDVHATLVGDGKSVNVNAVRNHLNKLVQDGDLERDEQKRYLLPAPVYVPEEFPPAPAGEDIPF